MIGKKWEITFFSTKNKKDSFHYPDSTNTLIILVIFTLLLIFL